MSEEAQGQVADSTAAETGAEGGAEATDVAAEPSAAESLLAKRTQVEGDAETNEQAETTTEEGKVDLLANKFNNVDALEEGYLNLVSKMRNEGKLAPEAYELALPEGFEVAEDDPLVSEFSELAKKHNLSNDAYNDIIKMKLEADSQVTVDPASEMEKLGENAQELISGLDSFYKSKLNAEEYAQVQALATTADSIKALDAIRKSVQNVSVPTTPAQPKSTVTEQDAQVALAKAMEAERNNAPEAPALRKKASAMFKAVYPDS